MGKPKNKIVKLLEAEIELQAIVPVKSIKQFSEHGLREITIKQDTEFGFEVQFTKDRISRNKININFGFGRISLKKEVLREALRERGFNKAGLEKLKSF